MRIPLYKTYRAFSELDDLTDAQCELLMRRVELRIGTNLGVGCLIGLIFLVLLAFSFLVFGLLGEIVYPDQAIPVRYEALYYGLFMLVVFLFPTGITLVIRDTILRRRLTAAIQYEVDRVRCLSCRYILIGQVASGGRIGCPECGASFALGELGITEDDLLPPGGTNAGAGRS